MDKKELQRRAGIITEAAHWRDRELVDSVWEARANLANALRAIRRVEGPGVEEASQTIDVAMQKVEAVAKQAKSLTPRKY